MTISITCPMCMNQRQKEAEIENEKVEEEELEEFTFYNADDWAQHILDKHPDDNRVGWAEHHLEFSEKKDKEGENVEQNP